MAQIPSAIIPRVLYVPSTLANQGTGHLRRCRDAVLGSKGEAALWLCKDAGLLGGEPFTDPELSSWTSEVLSLETLPSERVFPLIVVDFQKTPARLVKWLHSRAQVLVGWDEGGKFRAHFPFLVDSLPHSSIPEPNIRLPGLLGLPELLEPQRFDRSIRSVLVTFGGSDRFQLTRRFLEFLQKHDILRKWGWDVTVVKGPMSEFSIPDGFRLLEAPASLAPAISGADLVITSWGLTALESLASGTPVVLLNPSVYHEKLTKRAGLPSLGILRPKLNKLKLALSQTAVLSRQAARKLLAPPQSAQEYFRAFSGTPALCPVCRTSGHPVFARTENKSFHRCKTCSMEFLSVYQLPAKVYSDAYFFEDYQAQYGKTYLEDFAHIENLGLQRLEYLRSLVGNRLPTTVLDVGCAFGPFLSAASRLGLAPFGVDIAESAVRHVHDVLGFPSATASWMDFRWNEVFPSQGRPDLLTMWYVIEHFPDLDTVLKQVSRTLSLGGIFAFGTPNGRGLTRTFRGTKFWNESPDDHFSIWSRKNASSVLARYGFEILGFRNTGLHVERFPGLEGDKGWRARVVGFFGRRLGWGDTFEVYARKTKELS